MIVYFVRHASAGQRKAHAAQDEKRALDRQGVVQAHQMGRLLAAVNVEVDAVISSPLKRATQTASLIANEIGYEQKIERDVSLRPDATFDSFRRLLANHERKEAIMVVGHNPTISEFLSAVLSRGGDIEIVELKKGSVAKVDMHSNKAGALNWCVTPKLVQAAYDAATPAGQNGNPNGRRPKASKKPAPTP